MARWDRIMLSQRTCRSRTIRRLDDGEFRAFIGALCLAGESPVRGALLVSQDEPATVEDIADECGVEDAVAQAMIAKLLKLGTLVEDDTLGCLRFANWDQFNPEPKPSDTREAWRERKRRQRAKEREEREGGKVLPLVAAEEPL